MTAPNPEFGDLTATRGLVPWVRVASAADDPPSSQDVSTVLRPVTISRFAGGAEIDVARFDFNFDETGQRLQDAFQLQDWNRQVEIRNPTEDAEFGYDVLFWGETSTSQMMLDRRGETLVITAAVSPYLFGDIVEGQDQLDDVGKTMTVHADIVFNPLIDGKIEGNMSDSRDDDFDYRLFVSPESLRTDEAQEENDQEAEKWTLRMACKTMMFILNAGEDPIKNFIIKDPQDETPLTQEELDDPDRPHSLFEDAPEIENVRIPRGTYLPAALDRLLIPNGYNWYLLPSIEPQETDLGDAGDDENLSAQPKIVIYKQGSGFENPVFFQRIGKTLDLRRSNAPSINAEFDIADVANVVVGQGSFVEKEITIELKKTWEIDDDDLHTDELDYSNLESKYHNEDKQNVWRLWVANEAGDWNGVRDTTVALSFENVFDNYVQRRRRFFPCMTFADLDDRQRRPVFVEWADGEEVAAAAEDDVDAAQKALVWKPVPPEWGYQVLTEQLGVRFTGKEVPSELHRLGENALLRVTGTVVGDERLESLSEAATSTNSREVKLFLNLSDRFHLRERQFEGPLRSRFSVEALGDEANPKSFFSADVTDDLSDLQTFLDEMVEIERATIVTAEIKLETINHGYQIGDLVPRVHGRNLSFDRLVKEKATDPSRYMQITGIIHNWNAQQTTLRIESVDTPRL